MLYNYEKQIFRTIITFAIVMPSLCQKCEALRKYLQQTTQNRTHIIKPSNALSEKGLELPSTVMCLKTLRVLWIYYNK